MSGEFAVLTAGSAALSAPRIDAQVLPPSVLKIRSEPWVAPRMVLRAGSVRSTDEVSMCWKQVDENVLPPSFV